MKRPEKKLNKTRFASLYFGNSYKNNKLVRLDTNFIFIDLLLGIFCSKHTSAKQKIATPEKETSNE